LALTTAAPTPSPTERSLKMQISDMLASVTHYAYFKTAEKRTALQRVYY
jgi:hypothetical protein